MSAGSPPVPHERARAAETAGAWRARQPYPIFRIEPTVVTPDVIVAGETALRSPEDAAGLRRLLDPVRDELFAGIERGFRRSFDGVESAPRDPVYWRGERQLTPEELECMTVFNPIYLGPLPRALAEACRVGELAEFKARLRAATPELWPPPARDQGREMGIRGASPHFVNLVFVIDDERLLDALSADRKVALSRSFFAGFGSWKADIVSCGRGPGVGARLNGVWMGTLEGGHPFFPADALEELGWRHKVFAACKPVEVQKVPVASGETIPRAAWEGSASVEGIRASGRLLGRRGYLSDSVRLAELVASAKLARVLELTASYSQQGEGALFAWDPVLGKLLVSATGQMGAMKADLKLNEVVAIVEAGAARIGIVPVEGLGEPLKPSVEGPEFGFPLWDLLREHPVGLRPDGGGVRLADPAQARWVVPPIRAGGHLHRGERRSASPRVAHLDTDAAQWPPVGCGVDASDEYSHHVFRRATALWEESGRTLEFVTYPVHGHSTNYLQFYAAGKVNDLDHSRPLAEVLESGELAFGHDVPQVEQRLAPQPR